MKGLALPVEYLVILIIAIVVLLAVVVWYLYFFPHCPDPQHVFNSACRGWQQVQCKDAKDYVPGPGFVPDTRCITNTNDNDKIDMEDICAYAGLSEDQCRQQCCFTT